MTRTARAVTLTVFTALVLFGWVPLTDTPRQHAAATTEAAADERTHNAVQAATDATGAVPAAPGVSPAFVPRRAIVLQHGHIKTVDLDAAMAAGGIVAWIR